MLMQRQMLAGAALVVTPQQHGSQTPAEQPLPSRQTQQQQQHPDQCCPVRRGQRLVRERQAMQQCSDL